MATIISTDRRTLRLLTGAGALLLGGVLGLGCHHPISPTEPVIVIDFTEHLDIVSGDQQTGEVGTRLAAPLVVRATDDRGHPVAGALIFWTVIAGDGELFPTDHNGDASTTTDSRGESEIWWTVGPGRNVVQAQALFGLETVRFYATGRPLR